MAILNKFTQTAFYSTLILFYLKPTLAVLKSNKELMMGGYVLVKREASIIEHTRWARFRHKSYHHKRSDQNSWIRDKTENDDNVAFCRTKDFVVFLIH